MGGGGGGVVGGDARLRVKTGRLVRSLYTVKWYKSLALRPACSDSLKNVLTDRDGQLPDGPASIQRGVSVAMSQA